jgi:thiol-disulfide isomerase/thioredoxin
MVLSEWCRQNGFPLSKGETMVRSIFRFLIPLYLIPTSLNAQTVLAPKDSNETAPDFKFVTLSGENISSENLKGKIVVLDFWSSDCTPCVKSMPQMEEFFQKHKNDKRVAIYLVNSGWESMEQAKTFAGRKREHFLLFSWGQKYDLPFAYDHESATMKKFKLDSNPSTIIIDAGFRIHVRHSGYIKDFYDFLNEQVDRLLAHQ